MSDAERCPDSVLIKDDRWGAFRSECELDAGHPGDHRIAYTACEPAAYLGWPPSPAGVLVAVGPWWRARCARLWTWAKRREG